MPMPSFDAVKLTNCERAVLVALARGASLRQIAESQHRSTKTISNHCDRLRAKLGTDSKGLMIRWALRNLPVTVAEEDDWR